MKSAFYPVILAGGSGTRFWPRSRRRRAKQVLALDGKQTMIQKTVERLAPVSHEKDFWIITNEFVGDEIQRQLPSIPPKQMVIEPEPRNTAPAIGLAAFILERIDPASIIGMFPADHVIADEKKFRKVLQRAIEIAGRGENIVIDYAVLEPRSAKGEHSSNLYCLPADFGWNDLGSWAALYEHHAAALPGTNGRNVVEGKDVYAVNATGNYIYAKNKFVAAVGVHNLVVVETDDAILITTREHSQDVGKIVKYLNEKKLTGLVLGKRRVKADSNKG